MMSSLQDEQVPRSSNVSIDRIQEINNRPNETIASGPEHTASGIKTSLHGTIYQIKLLMLFLNRGIKHGYKFLLATEVDEADKFDDLVFSYDNHNNDGKVYRFLQAKHKQDSSKKIKFNDLLKEIKDDSPNKTKDKSNDDFSLLKYFVSYRKIKQNEMFEGELKDFILCTNIDLDDEVLKPDNDSQIPIVQINSTEDDILDFQDFPKSKRYKFSRNTAFYKKLQTVFKNNHSEKLAANLAKIVLNKEKTLPKDEMFKCYRGWLMDKVFKIETDNNGRFIKFRDDILQDVCEDDEALDFFCKTFKAYIKKGKPKEKLEDIVTKTKFKIPDTFTLDAKGALSLDVTNEEIDSFLDKLVLAVNQPNDMELQSIITEEIGKDLNFVNGEFIASRLLESILDWVKDKKGRFLMSKDSELLFKCLKQNLARLGLVGVTLAFKSKFDNGYYFKDNFKVIEIVTRFLKDEMKQVLVIFHKNKLLSAMKISQANKSTKVDSDLFFDLKTLQSLVGSASCPLDALQSEAYNHLVIDDVTTLDGACQVLKRIIEVLKQHPSKRIILNIAQKSKKYAKNLLHQLFRELDFNGEKFLTFEDDENYINNLQSESQKKLFNNGKVIFQGKEISLKCVFNENKSLISGDILSKLISNEKIEIGKSAIDEKYEKVKNYFAERTLQRCVFQLNYLTCHKYDYFIVYNSNFNESQLEPGHDIILISEDESEFEDLCKRFKSRTIHWLVQDVVKTVYMRSYVNYSHYAPYASCFDLVNGYEDWNTEDLQMNSQMEFCNNQLNLKSSRVVVLFGEDDLKIDRGYNAKFIYRLKQCDKLFSKNKNWINMITTLPMNQVTATNLRSIEIIILISAQDNDFDMLLDHYGDKEIHILCQKRMLLCKQFQGNLSKLHNQMSKHYKYKPEEVMALPDRVVILAAEPGMGKSVLLTHLAMQVQEKENNGLAWLVKIDLVRCLKDFSKLKATNETDVLKFLCRTVKSEALEDIYGGKHEMHTFVSVESNGFLSLNVDENINFKDQDFLEARLFICMYNSGKVIVLLDGFDEISPRFNNTCLDMIRTLKRTRLQKIWVSTRPYNIQIELENGLGMIAYGIVSLRKDEQIEMFRKFWETSLKIELCKEVVEQFIDKVLHMITEHIELNRVYDLEFISIPMHIAMIAATYENEFFNFYNSAMTDDCFTSLVQKFNLYDLYEKFLSTKLSFIYKDFEEIDLTHYYAMEEHQAVTLENHRYLALFQLFNAKELQAFLSKETIYRVRNLRKSIREAKEKTGLILRVDGDGNPEFVHRTFAEYFAADLLACMLDTSDKRYCRDAAVNFLYDIWLSKISGHEPLLNFFNYKLVAQSKHESDILSAVLNKDWRELETHENTNKNTYSNKLSARDSCGRTPLHLACCNFKWSHCVILFKRNKNDLLIQDELFLWTPLHYAVANVSKLYYQDDNFPNDIFLEPEIINLQDIYGKTAIMLAIELKCKSMITFLLKSKPDLNKVDKFGHMVLHYVDSSDLYFELIKFGASPYVQRDKEGKSLFDFLHIHHYRLIYDIIDTALNIHNENFDEINTTKHLITEGSDDLKIYILLHTFPDHFYENGAFSDILCNTICVNTQNSEGKSALRYAADRDDGQTTKLKRLLVHGAKVNIRDNHGKTALHYAIKEKHKLYNPDYWNRNETYRRKFTEEEASLDIIDCLLNNGADVNIKDNEDKTPLNYAVDCLTKLNQLLNDHGADSDIYTRCSDFTVHFFQFIKSKLH